MLVSDGQLIVVLPFEAMTLWQGFSPVGKKLFSALA
jgi:hypothetical protein